MAQQDGVAFPVPQVNLNLFQAAGHLAAWFCASERDAQLIKVIVKVTLEGGA